MFYRQLLSGLWIVWAVIWLIYAANTKSNERRESLGARLAYLLPLIVGGVLIGWRNLPAGMSWGAFGERLWARSLAGYWVGLAIVVAGLVFAVWARAHLGRNWSGTVTVKEGHELIRSGPYAYVRHPIYTGVLAMVIGTVLISATGRAVAGLVIIVVALVWKLRSEEVFMRETFPQDYERYSAEVPALVPFTKPRRSAPR
jgi:protein-S-isoprenylcysteine O-methyltransferase Ste14